MITISLWQPHASALFVPRVADPRMLKTHETRHWTPNPRLLKPGQKLAIHAAKTQVDPETREPLRDWWMERVKRTDMAAAFSAAGFNDWCDLPFGCVIGYGIFEGAFATQPLVAGNLVDSVESYWGDFSPGRFAWRLSNMTRLAEPVPCCGRQSLFEWTPTSPL